MDHFHLEKMGEMDHHFPREFLEKMQGYIGLFRSYEHGERMRKGQLFHWPSKMSGHDLAKDIFSAKHRQGDCFRHSQEQLGGC